MIHITYKNSAFLCIQHYEAERNQPVSSVQRLLKGINNNKCIRSKNFCENHYRIMILLHNSKFSFSTKTLTQVFPHTKHEMKKLKRFCSDNGKDSIKRKLLQNVAKIIHLPAHLTTNISFKQGLPRVDDRKTYVRWGYLHLWARFLRSTQPNTVRP